MNGYFPALAGEHGVTNRMGQDGALSGACPRDERSWVVLFYPYNGEIVRRIFAHQ